MLVSEFDFELPPELIAQQPPPRRGESRLLVLDRQTGTTTSAIVDDLPRFLHAGDVLVTNDTRVFPARLIGRRVPSGGRVECLLLGRIDEYGTWDALVHPGQKLRPGERFECAGPGGRLHGEIVSQHTFGRRRVRLMAEGGEGVEELIEAIGHVPLPPYIHRADVPQDRDRYQTIFARVTGSVAAPTAGLHFTRELLEALRAHGVELLEITLHVGYGTFKPVRAERVTEHRVDPEEYEVSRHVAGRIEQAKADGRRIVAVGTTTTRALESAALEGGSGVAAGRRATGLFIHPGFTFRVVDALFTNFHVPRSSLLMLVCAFGGTDRVLAAYRRAVELRFRFYSYGDAMLIV